MKENLLQHVCLVVVVSALTGCFTSNVINRQAFDRTVRVPVTEWKDFVRVGDKLYLEFSGRVSQEKNANSEMLQHALLVDVAYAGYAPQLQALPGSIPAQARNVGSSVTFGGARRDDAQYPPLQTVEALALYGNAREPAIDVLTRERNGGAARISRIDGWYQVPNLKRNRRFYTGLPFAVLADVVTAPLQVVGGMILIVTLASGDLRVTGL